MHPSLSAATSAALLVERLAEAEHHRAFRHEGADWALSEVPSSPKRRFGRSRG